MPTVLMTVGCIVVAIGGFFWLGSRSGFFPTFSHAGVITIGIGVAIALYGAKLKQAQRE